MNAAQFSDALGKVSDKYIMETIACERKRSGGWLRWGAMAACFGLIVTAVMAALPGLWKGPGEMGPSPAPDLGPVIEEEDRHGPAIDGKDDPGPAIGGDDRPDDEPMEPPEERELTIYWDNVAVNESTGPAVDALLWRDPALYNEEILDAQGVRARYGWELAPAYIPDGLTGGGKAVSGHVVRENATGDIVEEQAGRSFWSDFWEDGSPKSDDDIVEPRGFIIRASRLRILHCGLLPVEEERTTDFGGTPVTLRHASLPYGPFDPEKMDPSGLYHLPAGYYDVYTASFELDGVQYEIEADRLELEEVIRIAASIINTPYSEDFAVGGTSLPDRGGESDESPDAVVVPGFDPGKPDAPAAP